MNFSMNFSMSSLDPSVEVPTQTWGISDELDNDTASSDSYSFDYDDYIYTQFLYDLELALTYICFTLTVIVGTLGNLIVVYTIWRCRQLHTVMYTLLASLAVADLIVILLVLPWKMIVYQHLGSWIFGDFMCRSQPYLSLVSAVSSVFHLTAISLERCYAVAFPLKSRTVLTMGNAYRIMIVVWVSSIVAGIPIILSLGTKPYCDEFWGCIIQCRRHWEGKANVAFSLYLFFIIFGCPMIVITGAYCVIFRKILTRRVPSETTKSETIAMNKSSHKYEASRVENVKTNSVCSANGTQKLNKKASKSKEAELRQTILVLVITIVLFAICWGPKLIFRVLIGVDLVDRFANTWTIVNMAFDLMSYLNSAMNPVVYALVSANFRQSCVWALKVCCKSRNVRRPIAASKVKVATVSRSCTDNSGASVTRVENMSVSSVVDRAAGDQV